jgi:hypothetical protein
LRVSCAGTDSYGARPSTEIGCRSYVVKIENTISL